MGAVRLLPYYIRRIWDDALYHGYGKRRRFFEGWYYKLVDSTGKNRFAVIPGIALGDGERTAHAFIQILDGTGVRAHYERYDINDFQHDPLRFDIRIGRNRFTRDHVKCAVTADRFSFAADVSLQHTTPWPVTLFAPGIMGPYAFAPFMECYHGVLSLDHALEGTVSIDDRYVDMNDGRGYCEKDWGRSFPSAWVWMQTNHFPEPETSLTFSLAKIPWLNGRFTGCIAGLLLRGKLYRFASYTGARLKEIAVSSAEVRCTVADGRCALHIVAQRGAGAALAAPADGVMTGRIAESMSSRIMVTFTDRGKEIYSGEGMHGGLEVGGDITQLT
ncbi:MAG: hypothetical protein HZC28_01940 [Spirochaetes bacterium]|nr:hypothetical protein [Spirochaetota bacterium]